MSTVILVHLTLTGALLATLGAVTLIQALAALGKKPGDVRSQAQGSASRTPSVRPAGTSGKADTRTGEAVRHKAA